MKKTNIILLLSISLFCISLTASAAERIALHRESKLWLEGDSTLHPYRSDAIETKMEIDLPPGMLKMPDLKGSLAHILRNNLWKRCMLLISVKDLRSEKKGLDKRMYKAMKANDYPTLSFHLDRTELLSVQPFKVKAVGRLTVAGKEKTIELDAALDVNREAFWIRGSTELLMTDFGIDPPQALLGTVKTENAITIHYNFGFDVHPLQGGET